MSHCYWCGKRENVTCMLCDPDIRSLNVSLYVHHSVCALKIEDMLIIFVVIFIGLRIIDSHQQAVRRTNQADIETLMALHNGMDES